MASCPAVTPEPDREIVPLLHGAKLLTVRDWRELDCSEEIARWDALAQRAAEPNPFLESWYLLASLRALDPQETVRLVCFEVAGELAGILPLRRGWTYYGYPVPHWRNWRHPNCFLGAPLVARGLEKAFWSSLLQWADAHTGQALMLHLSHVPLAGPLQAALVQTCKDSGRGWAMVGREERAMLASNLSPHAYLEAALPAKKRKELRRQHRRLEEAGVLAVERSDGADGLAQWTDDFLALERSGWKGAEGSALASSPATERLFREALTGAAERGRLKRLALTLDGRPIAMLVSFLTPPGAFSFKTAFDEAYSRLSPGVLLQLENLAMLEKPGIEWTDSCAAADHPMIDHLWRERRAIGRINVAIGGPRRRALFELLARHETRRPAGDKA
jgi:CelD/BcsL family acetyltransferase involved in cellulose biosynthesis